MQSLARNRSPEGLAHEVVQLKEQVYQLQEQNVSSGMLMPAGGGGKAWSRCVEGQEQNVSFGMWMQRKQPVQGE